MSYVDDLLMQAVGLASADPKRPKQANLRRAVSAAYYALFHEAVEKSCAAVLSSSHAGGLVGDRLRRTIQHANALKSAKWFAGPPKNLPQAIQDMRAPFGTPQPAVDPSLRGICQTFTALQAERHRADYDLSSPFSRADANRQIADAQAAIVAIRSLQAKGDTLIFLLGCLFGESLTRNHSQ